MPVSNATQNKYLQSDLILETVVYDVQTKRGGGLSNLSCVCEFFYF